MATPEEIKAAEEAAATAAEEAKAKEAEEAAKAGITTDAGKEALRKEREAKRAAEKAAKEASEELAALRAKQAEADAAKAKADEAEALKRGEHETVITAKTAENEALKARVEAAEKRLAEIDAKNAKRIEDGLANVPDAFKVFDPGADAPLDARLAWFEKAIAQADTQAQTTRVPGVTPRPQTTTQAQAVQQEARKLVQSGRSII